MELIKNLIENHLIIIKTKINKRFKKKKQIMI